MCLSALSRVAEATEKFSRSLYSAMIEEVAEEENLLVSPFSAAAVLAMGAAGARGHTARQMWAGLGVGADTKMAMAGWSRAIPALRTNRDFTLETANNVFVAEKYKILDEYKESLRRIFHSDVSPVDFTDTEVASKKINSWVKNMTNEKIKELVDPSGLDGIIMVLVNAIYFKGEWVTKFDSKNTKKREFFSSPNEVVMADMMSQTEKFPFASLDDIDSQMLELPYKGKRIVMQILLPNKKDCGLKSLEKWIADVDISKMFEDKQKTIEVNIQMPKFNLTHTADLKAELITHFIKIKS